MAARVDTGTLDAMTLPEAQDSNPRAGWLARWEQREQARFDRERAEAPAEHAEWLAENIEVLSPTGRQYVVQNQKARRMDRRRDLHDGPLVRRSP